MVHLIVHLVEEAILGGPVQFRWMYAVERAQPEGSIAEGFIANECLTFCSRYLQDVETTFTRPQRNSDHQESGEHFLFLSGGQILGKVEGVVLDNMALAQAHRYVLLHYEGITRYRSDFLAAKRRAYRQKRATPKVEQNWLIHMGKSLKDDPFVFSSQAKQVFYVRDPKNNDWSQVICTKPRDLYDMELGSQHEDDDTYTEYMPQNVNETSTLDDRITWVRADAEEQGDTLGLI